YEGILYRSYYMADAATATIATSRMPLSTVWFAFAYALAGVRAALYSTPLFALLSLLLLYAVARRLFHWPLALMVAMVVAVSYPQIYFGRLSYAEIFGQFWTLAGILTALRWVERRSPPLLVLTLFFWATTWAGRIDALLLLPATYLLFIYAALVRDRRALIAVGLTLPLLAALLYLGTNDAYAGATLEIQQWRWPWFGNALLALLLLAPLSTLLAWLWGRPIQAMLIRIRPLLHLLAFGALAFVLLWATVPNPLRNAGTTRYYQEIIWFSSAYLTPLFYWLVLLGVGRLLWGGYDAQRFWLLASFASLAAVFFYTYTSARVYPVSLRRLTSDLLPLMALLIGVALTAFPTHGSQETERSPWVSLRTRLATLWQWGRWPVAVTLLLWMGWLSRPLLPIHEGVGTVAYLATLHNAIPDDAVLIFEDQDSDSWVGWLSAPLYSLYGDWTLLLDGDTPDPALWHDAVNALAASGRTVYVVTQQPAYPPALELPGYTATLALELPWQSTLIGQTNAPYPPPIWDFIHPLRLYRLEPTTVTKDAPADDTLPLAAILATTPISISAPGGKLQAAIFVLDDATTATEPRADRAERPQIYYRVSYDGQPVIGLSAITVRVAPQVSPLQHLVVGAETTRTVDESYTPLLGQNSTVRDHYNELTIALHETDLPARQLQLQVRLYDQGVALRQLLLPPVTTPEGTAEPPGIVFDQVDFTLNAADGAYYQAGTEGEYELRPVGQ
ncbi:MAG: glycoside hydrolase family 97 N-terminal domain-containing protein, partial [Caldilineaceae bacterium]|nr:glycoside hydrolase family 97 N-terminal domain-containing protein [Caldilineaceae bacterium]